MSVETKGISEKLKLAYVRGFPVPCNPPFSIEKIEFAMQHKAKDDDIVLVAYPKSGSTWLLYILWKILHKGQSLKHADDLPIVEMLNPEQLDSISHPRLYKHHISFEYIKMNPNAKYVYIHRKPEDTVVSFFYFLKELGYSDMEFEEFFDGFLEGQIHFGSMFDHVLAANRHRHDGNVLFVSYKTLKMNTKEEILRIAKFLGEDYHKMLLEDVSFLGNILEDTSFENMKKNVVYEIENVKLGEGKHVVSKFYRKGEVDEGRNHLNKEQIRRLREVMFEKMKGTEFIEIWSS